MRLLKRAKNPSIDIIGEDYRPSKYNVFYSGEVYTAVFNTSSGSVALIDFREKGMDKRNINDDFEELVKNGFLVPSSSEEFYSYCEKINFCGKNDINFFTIIPTTSCNARCFYCYEEEYCKKTIDDKTCDEIVDYIVQSISNSNEFVLDWFGGEPLLCVDKIDYIINQLRAKTVLENKKWSSSITTNGTLFTHQLINHAIREWRLESAHITLDGAETEHNFRKNYPGFKNESPYKLTKNAILKLLCSGVFVNLRIHLDNNNRFSFSEIVDDINDFFSFENFHLFPTYLFPPEQSMPISYIKDAEKEELFYNVFKTMKEKHLIDNICDLFPEHRVNGCFAERSNTIVIAPDGSKHTCVQGFWEDDFLINNVKCLFKCACEECKDCEYFPICLGGCLYNRNIGETVRTPCVRNRYIVKPLLRLLVEEVENSDNSI